MRFGTILQFLSVTVAHMMCGCGDRTSDFQESSLAVVTQGGVGQDGALDSSASCLYDASQLRPRVLGLLYGVTLEERENPLTEVQVSSGMRQVDVFFSPVELLDDSGEPIELVRLGGDIVLGSWRGTFEQWVQVRTDDSWVGAPLEDAEGRMPNPAVPPLSLCETWYADLSMVWHDVHQPACRGSFAAANVAVNFGGFPDHCRPPPEPGEPFPHEDSGD